MMTKVWQRVAMIATFMPALLLMVSAVAQETNDVEITTLEELTAESDSFYGETVALKGFVAEFVNINTIVVGENAGIDDDRILVINNTGETFSDNLFKNSEIQLQGVVHRSFDEHRAMMDDEASTEMTPEAEAMATEETDMDGMEMDNDGLMPLDFYYAGSLPDDYNTFTVLELTDLETLTILEDDSEE